MSDSISRQDAVNEIHKYFVEEIDKTPTEIDEDGDEVYTDMPTVNSLLACNKELSKRIKSLPSTEPKTMNKTNANKIYSYLKERIGDTVDDMKEFDAWFERMVWHVKECDRLAKEPKTGHWINTAPPGRDV